MGKIYNSILVQTNVLFHPEVQIKVLLWPDRKKKLGKVSVSCCWLDTLTLTLNIEPPHAAVLPGAGDLRQAWARSTNSQIWADMSSEQTYISAGGLDPHPPTNPFNCCQSTTSCLAIFVRVPSWQKANLRRWRKHFTRTKRLSATLAPTPSDSSKFHHHSSFAL